MARALFNMSFVLSVGSAVVASLFVNVFFALAVGLAVFVVCLVLAFFVGVAIGKGKGS